MLALMPARAETAPDPVPLDEYPIHQSPLSMEYVATSDRNFYDRCYFNAHDRTGDIFLITGLGYYPNLGVMDAYATVRRGDTQWAVRFSDAIADDRLHQRVGSVPIEVIEPLQKLRLVCDSRRHGHRLRPHVGGFVPRRPGAAARHAHGPTSDPRRLALRAARLVERHAARRRRRHRASIRTCGSARATGRGASVRSASRSRRSGSHDEPLEGFWWLYVPLRFDDFAVIVICQELPDGFRTLNDATRVWRDGRVEQLGWPEIDIRYRSGTRHPDGATLHLATTAGRRKPLDIEVETLGCVALHLGAGYGGDPTGTTAGGWDAAGPTRRSTTSPIPSVLSDAPIGVIDHVARASINGAEGWGLFEHATFGRHDPSGFADWGSVAP